MNQPRLSRRTVAKGIAWTVPVITATSAAPVFASSPKPPDPGLNGWVTVGGSCSCRTFDGTANTTGPDGTPYGLYVWDNANSPDTIKIENAVMVYYLRYRDYKFSRRKGGAETWSTPTRCSDRDEKDANGKWMYAYCSTYSGEYGTPRTITYNGVEYTAVPLNDRPNWLASRSHYCCTETHTWIRREVKINGVVTSCIRKEYSGPLSCDGGTSAAAARIASASTAKTSTGSGPM